MSEFGDLLILTPEKKKHLLKKLKARKSLAYYREGSFSDEVIWQGRKFVFPAKDKNASKHIWIFRSVMHDVREYLQDKRIRERKKLPVNHWNDKLKNYRGKITATDVDHAYWRIAFLQGVISEKTYKKGLFLKDKSLRLASLANLSSQKEYRIIEEGIVTNKTIVMKNEPILKKVYDNIRYACYQIMMNMAELLAEDFICYKTDCIYYKDTADNRMKVQEYLDKIGMEWKQLSEPERPKKESPDGTNHGTYEN
jgi:hypothetical protein